VHVQTSDTIGNVIASRNALLLEVTKIAEQPNDLISSGEDLGWSGSGSGSGSHTAR
jgi:hypothetical protein